MKYYQENDRLKSYEIDVPGNTTTRVELLQLKKYTNYGIQVLAATTHVSTWSNAIFVKTAEDGGCSFTVIF